MKQDSPAAPPEAPTGRSGGARARPSGIGEPVAIVGMACRFPGAENLDAFWRLLECGGNAISEGEPGSGNGRLGELFPDDAVRKPACRFGGFVDDIDLFDASFFRISPAEAQFLDPQQRMMLETSWEALEDAGIDPDRLKGSLTGVYTGISNDEYRMLVVEASKPAEAAACLYALSGTNLNGTSGRVAFVLGLMGPAKAVDAACASALVSLHDAVADLQQRKADLALAGGVQAMLSGRIYELRAEAMMLSPDGQCKAFDASANGYVRSEGCGVVVLKRLSDAEADGDRIWAVIRSVAVNHGGASAGLTVPHAPALEQVMEAALAQAGVPPWEVDYLEAHGTGTAVGDPIEIDAAAGVYGRGREPDQPLLVGSVKTNVGHLEAAAGVAGLIKAVLALHRGVIPEHLHFETPNPEIEWDRVPLRVTTAMTDWPLRPGRPRRAGVNCFGISGTNSHAVVEAYDPPDAAHGDGTWPAGAARKVAAAAPAALPDLVLPDGGFARREMRLLPLSGKSAGALREQAQRYLSWLDQRGDSLSAAGNASDPLLSDMAWTAATGRSHFGHRAGVAFHDASSLRARLAAVAESEEDAQPGAAARVAFAYTGQGSQWAGMGQALYDCEPVARTILDRCEAVFREERQASLLDVMFGRSGGDGDLGETAWEQPALYALQCALTALWRNLGVRPAAVIGHSVGELAAAQAAGVFGLEDGMRFAAARGALLSDTGPGAMLAVFAPAARTAALVEAANLSSAGAGLCISADNGTHRVVSGPVEDIEAMAGVLEAEGIRARRLNTKRAFHSALLDPVLDRLEASLDGIALAPPSLTLVSNLTGKAVEPGELMDGAYWKRHAREAVAFADGVGTLAGLGIDLVLEIGPRAVLAPMTVSAWPEAAAAPIALPSLHRPSESGGGSFTEAVARAYEAGLPLAFEGLFAGETRRRIALPSYPFQRERHWLDGRKRLRREAGDPLLGVRHESAGGEISFETELFPSDPAWLDDHKVFRRVIAPGALYAAMAASASLAEGGGPVVLEDMQLHSPLIFPEVDPEESSGAAGRTMQVLLSASEREKTRRVQVFSKSDDGNWAVHIEGRIPGDPPRPGTAERIDPDNLKAALEPVDVAAYYRARAGTGIDLGPAFRTLAGIWARPGEALGEVSLPDAAGQNGLDVHPLVLDGCFQVVGAARSLTGVQGSTTYLPFGCERLWLSGPLPDQVFCHARMRDASLEAGADDDEAPEVLSGELGIYDMDGKPLGGLSGYTVKRATRSALLSADEELDDLLYEIAWQSSALAPRLRSADFLADPAKALSCAGPLTRHLAAEGVEARDRSALLADLERLSHRHALAALEDLGWDRVAGTAVEPGKLRQHLQVEARHERLFLRLLEMLAGAGILTRDGDTFVVAIGSDDPLPWETAKDARALADRMRQRHAHGAVEIGFLQRCAESLADVLLGRADPVALLFSGEPSAADMYGKSAVARAGNRMLADVIGGLSPGLPEGRPLRVLEIGAGTGSATAAVLPELPDGVRDYTFTDISAGFFAEAESRFGGRDAAIEYRVLDIERDPATQGFETHGYDLVIASNVLHATQRLDETLAHCRALLAPAGLLVALERLMHQSWLDLTFGLLEGWWRFADAYRPRSPLAGPAVWRRALADAGFGEVAVSAADESDPHAEADRGVIVARGPAEAAEAPGVWVVTADGGGAAAELARELAARDQIVVLAGGDAAGDAAPATSGRAVLHGYVQAERRESWKSLLEGLPGGAPLQGIVHLAALAAHGPEAATEQVAGDVKRAVGSALAMVQGVADSGIAPARGLWLVTRGAQVLERERDGQLAGAALWGFGKAVAREAPELRLRMIDLDPQEGAVPPALSDELLSPDRENHIAYRDGRRNVARLVRMEEETDRLSLPDGEGWLLAPDAGGSLDGIRKRSLPARPLEPREVRVAVEAAGADFKDVLSGLGLIDTGLLGGEFCGRVLETGSDVTRMAAGDPVLGLAFGTFRSEVVTREEMVVAAPPGFPVVELATMPTVFVSAALSFDLAGLRAGDRVLVHAGSGGVGLAAIQLAQAAGAKVFATASERKQAFLRSQGVEHVYDSRTTAFGGEILEDTGGAGVDVVLNSLTGEGFIEASLSCLARGGRFVELARLNILSEEEMSAARPDVAYSVLQVDVLKETDQALIGDTLGRLMKRLAAGELKPIVRNRWPMAEARAALKFMQAARHVGKIVLTAPQLANGRLRAGRTYLVTGGLGGIGCAVAGWLADRGAGTIVLNGRRAPDPAAEKAIRSLEERGVDVVVKIADMADTAAVDAMLASMDRDLPPLGGVIHSVGVLSDGALTNQSWERFEQVLWPKIKGAWHLHRATAERDLDLFILFSSRVGVIGNPGQSNHATANAFLDQLAAHRRALGLPGQAIAWGAWSEIGEAAEQRDRIEPQRAALGGRWFTPQLGLAAFDRLVRKDIATSVVMSMDWSVFDAAVGERPPLMEDLLSAEAEAEADADAPAVADDLLSRLRRAAEAESGDLLLSFVRREVQAVLRLSAPPPPAAKFFDLGMDSLMAVELRNRLNRAFAGEYVAPNTVVFDYPDAAGLAGHLAEALGEAPNGAPPPARPEPGPSEAPPQSSADRGGIAVVGMACRFPGAPDLAAYWDRLATGADVITDGRPGSGDWRDAIGDPGAGDPAFRRGGFVRDLDGFDARFFRIRPIEARTMDPQQRMLLETSWHALEDAGLDPGGLRGSRTGVYAGLSGCEYRDLINDRSIDIGYLGTAGAVAAGRVAFVLGLMGPAMPIDMTCASSLAALHEAAGALRRKEVDLALAGGVNAVLSPARTRFMLELGMLSPTGRCRTFDASADGHVRGEGCGMVVLKRLEEAEADGDRIWGVIRGSAVNHNGTGGGLTLPNGLAQQQVIEDALSRAGVAPAEVDYLEAHGTGSALGDTIELQAVSATYGRGRDAGRPLLVGTAKTNLGHLEAAAGIAGLIKVVLAMRHGTIPRHLHFDTPNPNLDWDRLPVRVTSEPTAWPADAGRPARAGVSAFAISGSNVHMIVEGYGAPDGRPAPEGSPNRVAVVLPEAVAGDAPDGKKPGPGRARILPLSGNSDSALRTLAERYLSWLDERADDLAAGDTAAVRLLSDMAWTAGTGRSHLAHRSGVVFHDLASLRKGLTALVQAGEATEPREAPKIAFAYPGQDDRWAGIGEALHRSEPVARAVLERCDAVIRDERGASLLDRMFGRDGSAQGLDDPAWAFPAIHALECALAALWASVGIRPSAVVGFGAGDLAAAHTAGVFGLDQGLRLAAALGASDGTAGELPGDPAGGPTQLPFVGGRTGREMESDEAGDYAYWLDRVREPAAHGPCARTLSERGIEAILELGPGPSLGCPIADSWPDGSETAGRPLVLSSLRPSSGRGAEAADTAGFSEAVASAYEAGLPVSFAGLFAGEERRRISLPGYPFERRRYWIKRRSGGEAGHARGS